MDVKITPHKLEGKVVVPPSKSISHRAIIAGALSRDNVEISNLIFSKDIEATISGMSKLGSAFEKKENKVLIKKGDVTGGVINCFESGSTVRFLIPIGMTILDNITFTGENNLVKRPQNVYLDLFREHEIPYEKEIDELPLTIKKKLSNGVYKVRGDVSSQFITGLLFALPLVDGQSKIIITTPLESKGYIDLSLDVLEKFGINIVNNDYREFIIDGNQKYQAINYSVEGDYSQSAFWLVASSLCGDILLAGMNEKSLQGDKEIIDFINKMGGNAYFKDGFLTALKNDTNGATIDLSQAPDLGPIITVLASLSKGTTKIVNAERLRIKESDRITAMRTELNKLGAHIEETPDGMIIEGVEKLHGGICDSWNDHRIAMSLAIASLKCDGDIVIRNAQCINKSYPHFFKDFEALGGKVSYE